MAEDESCIVYFLGIGGIGMSALAHIALEKGRKVCGIDRNKSQITRQLEEKGAEILIGDDVSFDGKAEVQVIYSSAIRELHPVLQKAKQLNYPLYHRSMFLSMLMKGQESILITGTHGKTSTTALVTWVLVHAGFDPSYAVGGIVMNTGKNGGHGTGKYFVAEADESDGSFLNYNGHCGIITNVEQEHMNYWKTEERLHEGFKSFASQIEKLFWCVDDSPLSSLKLKGHSYGTSEKANWHLYNMYHDRTNLVFSISHAGHNYENIRLSMMGRHQALNATAAWGLACKLGVPEERIRQAFLTFGGVCRRLEKKGEVRGIIVYDDYAHHPTEIAAVLTALKEAIPGCYIRAIFQAHKYSRTHDCLHLFPKAFQSANSIIITEIYSAGEQPIEGISGKTLSSVIPGSSFMSDDEILEDLKLTAKAGDVIITIGAGTITLLGPKILSVL